MQFPGVVDNFASTASRCGTRVFALAAVKSPSWGKAARDPLGSPHFLPYIFFCVPSPFVRRGNNLSTIVHKVLNFAKSLDTGEHKDGVDLGR